MLKVLVIAGTWQAKQIIDEIFGMGVELAVAVTSKLGCCWLKQYTGVSILEGRLTLGAIIKHIENNEIRCLIDASMPAARDISLNAENACKKKGISYIRYEISDMTCDSNEVMLAKNFGEAVNILDGIGGNILLVVGMGKIDAFCKVPNFKNRFFALVYPESSVIARCEKLGLNAEHIIAMKGPFDVQLYVEILKYCKASVIIARDNGNAAANLDKLKAAKELGVPIVLLKKPGPEYGRTASGIKEVIDYVDNLRKMIV